MIELALPAGTLENALVAFRSGADAVYFGLKDFSARKGAGNFSFEDLSKIREFSLRNNKKTYITINTLIDDDTLPRVYETLDKITEYGTDGIICQDLGVARLIKRDFPSLPLHASTQLAVHTVHGVKELQKLGFERVVLSRELNLDEIKHIRKECPDVELKVFIHGALCYGFSGLCMASKIKTGRSANEGACAQVCRTWFNDITNRKKLYPFSLEDICAGEMVKELEAIGIDSLKIEGRLKGNEYVAATASYYRAIIDNTHPELYKGLVQSSFQRISGSGYLDYSGPGHKCLNTGVYTGHYGEKAGRVVSKGWNTIKVEEDISINPYDGLLILSEDEDGNITPIRFSSHILKREHNVVTLALEDTKGICVGDEVRRISNSAMKEKTPSLDIPLSKQAMEIRVEIFDNKIVVNSLEFDTEATEGEKENYKDAFERIFSQTGASTFSLKSLDIINKSSFKHPFVRASEIKRIRRSAYESIKPNKRENKTYSPSISKVIKAEILPSREKISSSRAPWNLEGKEIDGKFYLAFPPVTYNEEKLFDKMDNVAKSHENVRIGLNNIGQIAFALAHPEYKYFADIYLYLSNREAANLLLDEEINLVGGYLWLERDSFLSPWPFEPTIIKDFLPPLFISRSCYRHDSLGLDCKGCTKHHSFKLEQNGELYDVFVDNCQTVVMAKK